MHYARMRTHTEIASGPGMAERLSVLTGQSIHTCRSWAQRDSIPGKFWAKIARDNIASLEELALAAAQNPDHAPSNEVKAA